MKHRTEIRSSIDLLNVLGRLAKEHSFKVEESFNHTFYLDFESKETADFIHSILRKNHNIDARCLNQTTVALDIPPHFRGGVKFSETPVGYL